MQAALRVGATRMQHQIARGSVTPAAFRAALMRVPPLDRDAWWDGVCGLDGLVDDGPALPRGCVPYLPCSVATLVDVVEHAPVQADDVFVDIGAGLGRALSLTHLLTGAGCIGVEIQPELVREARRLATRLNLTRAVVVEGDAAERTDSIATGTVFFLYCPFSGARLSRVLRELEVIARARQIRVCCVDLPLPELPWLTPVALPSAELTIYRSRPVR